MVYIRGDAGDMYGGMTGGPAGYHHRSDSPMSGYHPPARSPTGSHSTPSPHSQVVTKFLKLRHPGFYLLVYIA